ncbi:MAG: LD-carboxypeptidase [Deltaproteobacteria bacterium]|nr:LD-carboxypeptidase [Deltaproteobacteria bacterium]
MPKLLKAGDVIGIAAPSSPFDRNQFKHGVAELHKMGFEVWHRDDIFQQERYLAGSDERRAEELTELFTKKDVRAVMFARGGYGSQRIIKNLKIEIIKKHKKPVIGFSDITALLTFLMQEAQMPVFYGPVITQLGKNPSARTMESLKNCLMQGNPAPSIDLTHCHILKEGSAEAALTGGCLSLIASGIGTPYELQTKDSILFFEDTGEKVYALDRMLTHLKNAEKLSGVQGIIVGSLEPKEEEVHSIDGMLEDILKDFAGPVVTHFPAGHLDDFITLPLGVTVRLDTQNKKLDFSASHFK